MKCIYVLFNLLYWKKNKGVEEIGANDESRDRRSDFDNSEDERRRSKIGNLKKKAINASNKFTHSLKKRGKKKIDYRAPSVSIEDVRDAKEEGAVHELRQKLLHKDLLPPRHDDYHTLLRSVVAFKHSGQALICSMFHIICALLMYAEKYYYSLNL